MCWVVVEIRMNITLIRAEIPLIRSSHFNFEISHVFLSLQSDFKKVSDTGTFVMVSKNAVYKGIFFTHPLPSPVSIFLEGKRSSQQMSSVQNPGWLFYIEDEILPSYITGLFHKPL